MGNTMKLALTFFRPASAVFRPSKAIGAVLVVGILSSCTASKWHETKAEPKVADASPMENSPAPFRAANTPAPVAPAPPPTQTSAPHKQVSSKPLKRVSKIPPRAQQAEKHAAVAITGNSDRSKYFVIQNIATEKLRVYINCPSRTKSGACVHKMLFEADMAAGRDTQDGRSLLGSYMISRWFKFYEDQDHNYPSFLANGYPDLPHTGARLSTWLSHDELPDGQGLIRGSFGWYTAKLEPNANEQWTHGTLGWGGDGNRFIKEAKKPSNARIFPRSEGCTRVENRVIALMREILPTGTLMFKVYAKEAFADSSLSRYSNDAPARWSWILTSTSTMSTTAKSGLGENALARHDDIRDRGTYTLDQTPKVFSGNLYHIPRSSFSGVFFVDEGRLAGYVHPSELGVGGFKKHALPALIVSKRIL